MPKIKIKKENNEKNKNTVKIKIKKDKVNNFMYYPEFIDKDFYEKIYVKKEFFKNKIPPLDLNEDSSKICNSTNFVLAPQQEFLKNFISVDTPYNGVLIYHGTGVGKTCSAIQIAEGFKEIMNRIHTDERRQILVLLGPRIIPNFKNNIYNIFKESDRKKPDDIVQCTGNTYSLDTDEYKSMTLNQKYKEIKKNIKNYYKFYGYEQFSNDVMNFLGWDGKLTSLNDLQKNLIKNRFKNRIIIIDEIHNIKSTSSNIELRKVPPILQAIVKYSENLRLILMSATPMYDNATEIIYILNLLLENDKKELIKNKSEIFDSDNNLVPGGDKKLYEYCKGYISYLRGNNPITFPLKVYPSNSITPNLKYDINGNKIRESDKFRNIKLFLCKMSEYQYKIYKNKIKSNVDNGSNNNNNLNKNKSYSKLQPLFYISNIILPDKNFNNILAKKDNYAYQKFDNGLGPFIIDEKSDSRNKKKYFQFKFQNHVKFNYGTKQESSFLDEKNLEKFSTKFYNALNKIKNGKGICYVYSEFVWGGTLPFALMLEQNGFERYKVSGEKPLLDYPLNKNRGGGKKNPICAICGLHANNIIHTNKKLKGYHQFKTAKYVLVTGNINLSRITTNELTEIINSSNNKYGEELKVIIGTRTTGEGLDFKRIRQVHILEPWYNLSRIDQITGRAIRRCSHIDLPKVERNVEIYLYASAPSEKATKKEKETEMIDTRFYRKAEIKDIKIKEVEYILKRGAIDCVLNKNGNFISSNKEINIITSSEQKLKIRVEDEPYSRECNYIKNCNYDCVWSPKKGKKYTINTDTYTYRFVKTDIYKAKRIIKNMYKLGYVYNLNDLISNINSQIKDLEDKFIYQAISELIDNKNEPIYDQYDRKGYLIYRGLYYIYQPLEFNYEKAPLLYRRIPINPKPKDFVFENYLEEQSNYKNNKNNNKKLDSKDIEKNVIKNIEKLNNELKYYHKNKLLIISSMILDKISNSDKIILLKNLIKDYYKTNGKLSNPYYSKFIEYFDKILLYKNRDLLKKNNSKNDKIFGFNIDNKFYCVNEANGSISECSTDMKDKLKTIKKLKEINKKKIKDLPYNNIYGFMEKKNDKFIFKVYDNSKETGALTLEMKRSKRSVIKGKKCSTFKSPELLEIIKKLNININETSIKKMCINIEYQLRRLNLDNHKNKKWFKNSL